MRSKQKKSKKKRPSNKDQCARKLMCQEEVCQEERALLPEHPYAAEPDKAHHSHLKLLGAHFFEDFAP
jgi:hypothetical protein